MGILVNPLAMFCRVFRGWTAFRHHSALVEVLCCYWQSGHEQAAQPPRRPHASHISCRDISMAEPSGLSTVWLGQLQKQLQSRSKGEAARGINLHPGKHPNNHHGNHSNPHLGNVTEWLHAPTMLLRCVDTWLGKSRCHSSLEHDYHLQTAGFFFVHRISCAILGSQNALIKVGEVLRLWPAVIAILPSLEPQQLSNSSHNYSFPWPTYCLKRIPASTLTMQTLHAAFH